MTKRKSKAQLKPRDAIVKMAPYRPPSGGRAGKMRLDFNENTAGCSPAVLRALAKLSAKQLAMYPEYEAPTRRPIALLAHKVDSGHVTTVGLRLAEPEAPTDLSGRIKALWNRVQKWIG